MQSSSTERRNGLRIPRAHIGTAAFAVIAAVGCGGADGIEGGFETKDNLAVEDATADSGFMSAFLEDDGPIAEDSEIIEGSEIEESTVIENSIEIPDNDEPSVLAEKSTKNRLRIVEGFNSPNWGKKYKVDSRGNLTYLRKGCVSGGCIRIRMKKGSNYGAGFLVRLKRRMGREPEQLTAEYQVLYEPSMGTYSGKAPGFFGTYGRAGWGGRPSDGYNGWSARGAFYGSNGRNGYYVYHAQQKGK